MNANKFIYQLFRSELPFPTYPISHCIHVRDVAKAHLSALRATPVRGQKKRLILNAGQLDWVEAIEYLQKQRPAIASRLPDVAMGYKTNPCQYEVDSTFSDKILGLEYTSIMEILLEVVDYLLEWERDKESAALTDPDDTIVEVVDEA